MPSELGKRVRLLASAVSVLVLLAVAAGAWFYLQLRRSLPALEGEQAVPGLSAAVTIARDAFGVPVIRGDNRADVARALGFLHAQERFFQMDTLRRRPAGELAELVGKAALPLDRATRPHRFRARAQQVLAELPAGQRALLEHYTAGANAGLATLGRSPFEYLLLRTDPQPWRAEDCLLIAYAMTLELQDDSNTYERSLLTLRDTFGTAAVAFFAPLVGPDDAALDGTTAPLPATPGPTLLNLRARPAATANTAVPALAPTDECPREDTLPGSNSFAVTGAYTPHHGALLANDPHLQLGVPNIWYRAQLEWPGTEGERHRVVGVTLPGLPLVVLGSNGHVAWGMTDAYADTNDFISVEAHADAEELYRLPGVEGLQTLETRRDTIAVKGERPEVVETRWTPFGPVLGKDSQGRHLVHHWVAYEPGALNLDFVELEQARSVAEAVAVAHRSGIPAHNFVVADRAGAIAWTIAGRFPRRVGYDGRLPVSWLYGDRRWDGFVPPNDVPTISVTRDGIATSPAPLTAVAASGKLWTANHRALGGPALAQIGDGGYAAPARAAQVRAGLAALGATVSERDLLAVQLDDRALFLERWRHLMQQVLVPSGVDKPSRTREALRAQIEHWEGRASVDSVSYRLVRAFRHRIADRVLGSIFEPCRESDPTFDWHRFNYEPALWQILAERPLHLLPARFASWDELLGDAADAVSTDLDRAGVAITRARWGEANRAAITHPIGRSLPAMLARRLNMPADPLAGDAHMPRIQSPKFGASMRLVVAPGHEEQALFHMPGGQSGHPLSPYYRAGHDRWVRGEPLPLLAGPTQHTLTLRPAR